MATRTITAMFNTREEAERAGQMLVGELGLGQAAVRTSPAAGTADAYDASRPYEEKGFFASLKDFFIPDEDRFAYAEGMRRGAVLLNATVDETQVDRVSDMLEHAGAVDLDEQEASWRESGWTGYDATAHAAALPRTAAGTAPAATGTSDTLKVVKENLVVGKREVERGRVKVRTYVVERPVEEVVHLHEEQVHVERRPVDRPATAADMAAFEERVVEASAMREEAVVSKEARVIEEIGIHKDAVDRTETVRDTVRETKVDVEDTVGAANPGHGAGVAGAIDRTLNTNVSGTNPGADAPDGTAGNPPGTMASRTVDKTLGTNISGANPGRR